MRGASPFVHSRSSLSCSQTAGLSREFLLSVTNPSSAQPRATAALGGEYMLYRIVGANIDTWLINVKGKLADVLADELERLKAASQEADEDVPARWTFAGETLFI